MLNNRYLSLSLSLLRIAGSKNATAKYETWKWWQKPLTYRDEQLLENELTVRAVAVRIRACNFMEMNESNVTVLLLVQSSAIFIPPPDRPAAAEMHSFTVYWPIED